MIFIVNDMKIEFDEVSLCCTFQKGEEVWHWREAAKPRLECEDAVHYFADALTVSHRYIESGLGKGIQSHYEGFESAGNLIPYAFDTLIWVEEASGDVFCEWVPLSEEGLRVKRVYWPGEMEFEEQKESWYTLLNCRQGILIPNTWETALSPLVFDGFFGTAGGYMPWIAQVRGRTGYLAVCTTPWNAGYQAAHPAGGPYTHVGIRFEPSLGKMEYHRIVKYTFLNDCDYNDICKVYRTYVKEQGRLKTLSEKAAKTHSVDDLIGCFFVHKGIKTKVQKDSDFFDPEAPDQNSSLTRFEERAGEMRALHQLGAEKVYLHLDGWAEPGYDNQHPDYYPACADAGGWEGMKELSDTMQELGYLFGIHDQYRDYYLAAPSYDEHYACRLADQSVPGHRRWAGGPQTYLCGTQAPGYVKRNFRRLAENGIHLDCAYLDVFTCNEGDECASSYHRMTRRDCYDYRNLCFEYLLSTGILPSSEEVSDWSIPSLVFCHYAPYDFMLREPGTPKEGIPVPLYNLVYHDCVIEPWMMDKVSENEDYMLYALLNGGAPYLIRDGAYPNIDGSFETKEEAGMEENIQRCRIVAKLHEKVAKCEMVRHEMCGGNPWVQKTVFSDGTTVTVDFRKQEYEIGTVEHQTITDEMMQSGELYCSFNEALYEEQWSLNDLTFAFNQTRPSDKKRQRELLEAIFGEVGEECVIEPPLRANWGKNTYIGKNVYVNFNLTLVDDADIIIGDDVMIGPNVTLATASHPLDAGLRRKGMQSNRPIRIEDGVWIGAGAVILPGVTIGRNTTIGAGSVVTKDIPANVAAYGNPCRVQKKL